MNGKIVNYFVTSSLNDKDPYCFKSPITVNNKVALDLIKSQYKDYKIKAPLLHVCFDVSSQAIYVLNRNDFSQDQYDNLIAVAKYRVVKDYGSFKYIPIITGSPYSSFRIRDISDFSFANKIITNPLPIIEVNLDRMPTVIKSLPPIYQQINDCMGGYVDRDISFVDEIDNEGRLRQEPIFLWNQKPPFVLINTSRSSNPSPVEKERIILNAHRVNMINTGQAVDDIDSQIDLYTIRSSLCLGWSFEEVSSVLLRGIKDFGELIAKIQRLLLSVSSLIEDGYKDVSENNYYVTFEFDPSFPLKLSNIMDYSKLMVKEEFQINGFRIVNIDVKNGFITIKTPVFLSPDICSNILKAKSKVYMYQYNPVIKQIDVKTEICSNHIQHQKVIGLIINDHKLDNNVKVRENASSRGEWAINPNVFNIKKVSDYLYCYNLIMEQCLRNKVPFRDLDVIIGPIEKLMGKGSQGGFMSEDSIKTSKTKFPIKVEDGIELMPPIIMINSVTEPSCIQQMSTLLHEYRHYVYSRVNRYCQSKYGRFDDKKGDNYLKQWYNYLSDPNEIEAHMEEIRFEFMVGKNEDEIIRDKIGGEITLSNYPIAIKFKELVDRVVKKEAL